MKYDKLIKEHPELVERVLDQVLENGELLAEGYQSIINGDDPDGEAFVDFYYAARHSKYTLFGIEIEGEPPLSEEPEIGAKYLTISIDSTNVITLWEWKNSKLDFTRLERGLVWTSDKGIRSAAIALGLVDEPEKQAFKVGYLVKCTIKNWNGARTGIVTSVDVPNLKNHIEVCFDDGHSAQLLLSELELVESNDE